MTSAVGWFGPTGASVHAAPPSLTVDTGFGTAGAVTYDGATASDPGCGTSDGTLLTSSAVLVESFCNQAQRSVITKVTADGSLDATYGVGGHAVTDRSVVNVSVADPSTGVAYAQPNSLSPLIQRITAGGQLDMSFGSAGTLQLPAMGDLPRLRSAAVDATGRVVLHFEAAGSYQSTLVRLTAAGVLDTSFGSGGLVSLTGNVPMVAVRPTGEIVWLSFNAPYGAATATIGRLSSNGSADGTFAAGGTVQVPLTSGSAYGSSIVVDAAGAITMFALAAPSTLAKITPSGALDAGFDGDGIRTAGVLSYGPVIDPADGSILTSSNPTGNLVSVSRIPASGSAAAAQASVDLGAAGTLGFARVTAVASGGRPILSGWTSSGSTAAQGIVARLLTGLTLDATFDGDGIATTVTANYALLTPADEIGVVGDPIARLDANGQPDGSFSGDGLAPLEISRSSVENGDGIVADSAGRLVVGGSRQDADGPTATVWRYLADGTLDPSFGSGGVADVPVPVSGVTLFLSDALPVGIDSAGRPYLLVSWSYWDTFGTTSDSQLVRLTSAGSVDAGYAPSLPQGASVVSIDGTGAALLATYDAVIRLSPTGAVDTSFGKGGSAVIPDGAVVVTDSTGRMLACSSERCRRLTSSGQLDGTFGVGGEAALPALAPFFSRYVPEEQTYLQLADLAITDDGGAVIRVDVIESSGDFGETVAQYVGRLTADGTFDPTFDGDGFTRLPDVTQWWRVVPLRSGVAVVGLGGAVARLRADGTLDTGFSGDGLLALDSVPATDMPAAVRIGDDLLVWDTAVATINAAGEVTSLARRPGVSSAFFNDKAVVGASTIVIAGTIEQENPGFVLPSNDLLLERFTHGSKRLPAATPVAVADSATTEAGQAVDVAVTANDSVSVGGLGSPAVVVGPGHGSAAVQANGSVRYTPAAGFSGTDSFRYQVCSSVDALLCARATVSVTVTAAPTPPGPDPDPVPLLAPLTPARLMDTRPGSPTVDGQFAGIGVRGAGTVTELQVAGRGGVPADATAVALNVTVTEAQAGGFVTVFPCDAPRPEASNLNFVAGDTVPNAVVAKLSADGKVCLFTFAAAQLIVDVNGGFPSGSDFAPLTPARLLDSRPGSPTIDGQFAGIGARDAGAVTELQVTGRGGVPTDAAAVALNVTATEAQAGGFVTVFPCGSERPEASNLNFVAGDTVPNAVVAKLSADGKVCLFTYAAAQLIVDVNGAFPVSPGFGPLTPARLLDSRPGSPTVDGQFAGIGARDAGAVTELQVTGRGGVPVDATAVALNVTVTEAQGGGFVTVFPCGSERPEASNLNFVAGDTVANAVIAKLSADGKICLFTFAATQLIVDVNGSFR